MSAEGTDRERDRDPRARDERHQTPEDPRDAGEPDRSVAHVVGAAEQVGAAAARRTEHLQRGHALEPVDELGRERSVALRPEPHVRAERPVLDRWDGHDEPGEDGDDRAHHRIDDPDHDDDRDGGDPGDDDLRQEQPEVRVELLDPVDEDCLELSAPLLGHPPGPELEDPVHQAMPEVGGDADGGARHQTLLDRRAARAEEHEGDGEPQPEQDAADGLALEDAADRDRDRDPRGDAGGRDDQAEDHRAGERAAFGHRQTHQAPIERARRRGTSLAHPTDGTAAAWRCTRRRRTDRAASAVASPIVVPISDPATTSPG